MKKIVVSIVVFCCAISVFAVCTREKGETLLVRLNSNHTGVVVTNGSECVRTIVDEKGEYRYFYSTSDKESLKVRAQYSDGQVEIYDYRNGRLDSAAWCSTNKKTMVMTMFVGDGKDANQVDRIETLCENGKISGAMRVLDVNGKEIKIPKPSAKHTVDKEYQPQPGSTGRLSSYEWTIVEDKGFRYGVLSKNGKKVIAADFCLGGKYPWIVGYGYEDFATANRKELKEKGIIVSKYGSTSYYFVIDMRTDHIEYVAVDKVQEIDKIIGFPKRTIDMQSFWGLFLSKRGPERLAKLEAALRPPVEVHQTMNWKP